MRKIADGPRSPEAPRSSARSRTVTLLALMLLVVAACTSGPETQTEAQPRQERAPAPEGPRSSAAQRPTRSTPALVSSLRRGGYVIYFRHALTDPTPDDAATVDFGDCTTQRNLSGAGRTQSRLIGRAVGALDIPIGRVLVSPYCRTRDTARLAFGKTSTAAGLENLETATDEAERQQRIGALERMLSTTPPKGQNTVLVAHGFNITGAASITLDEGEAAVFEPRPGNTFRLVTQITPERWSQLATKAAASVARFEEFEVPAGSHPHDVAPAPDGSVWYTAQEAGELGRLDPATGRTHHIPLGEGSAPHGVIVGPDGAPWITDGGLNAIVRVDPQTERVRRYPLPDEAAEAHLNTATFDGRGVLWFTGNNGFYGRLDPDVGRVQAFPAPRGPGPYGITATPGGDVYYASLAGSHIARIDTDTSRATVIQPPTPDQGARRIWSDSRGRLWVSEYYAGQLAMYDPASSRWREWRLPGSGPLPYAMYVDHRDIVWLSDFGANAIVRFDPRTERFESYTIPTPTAEVRQLLGRPNELWGAESRVDKLVVLHLR